MYNNPALGITYPLFSCSDDVRARVIVRPRVAAAGPSEVTP